MKYLRLTPEQAGQFYAVHKERPFYGELVSYMSSGAIVAAVLQKDNAVADYRKLIKTSKVYSSGRLIVTVVPKPGSLARRILPPCCRIKSRA